MTSKIVVFNDFRNSMIVADSADATITSDRHSGGFVSFDYPSHPTPTTTRLEATFNEPYHTVLNEATDADKLEALGFGEGMKLVRQGTPIDHADVRKGDRIRIEWTYDDGTTLAREETVHRDGRSAYAPRSKVYLLERPKPYVPSTPGSVIVAGFGGKSWTLDLDGSWRSGSGLFKGDPDFEFYVIVDKDEDEDDED